jgi:dipeptidase D
MNLGFEGDMEFVPGPVYRLSVTGLKGGHSVVNIDNFVEVRVNAIIAALHALKLFEEFPSYRIASIEGGEKDNAIPRSCIITLCGGNYEIMKSTVEMLAPGIIAGSPEGKVTFEKISDDGAMAFSREFTHTIVGFFNGVPNGVLDRCPDEPGLPPTISDNFGVVRTEGGKMNVTVSFRAYDDDYRDRYSARVARVAEQCGAVVEIMGKYPGWDKTPTSPLRDKMCQVWSEMTGNEMKVQRIHAGLECGVLIAKKPQLDAASIGPEMWDVHTPKEKLNVPSAERTYGFLCKLLSEMK